MSFRTRSIVGPISAQRCSYVLIDFDALVTHGRYRHWRAIDLCFSWYDGGKRNCFVSTDAVDVASRAAILINQVRAIRHQTTSNDEVSGCVAAGNRCRAASAMIRSRWRVAAALAVTIRPALSERECRDGAFDFGRIAHVDWAWL